MLPDPPPRIVTLVLTTSTGDVLGRLPAFRTETPWWQDAETVVRAARQRFGLDVTVLRLLETELPSAHGGAVTYLAEVDPDAAAGVRLRNDLLPWGGLLGSRLPLRLGPWPRARPAEPPATAVTSPSTVVREAILRWSGGREWRGHDRRSRDVPGRGVPWRRPPAS